jgi:hypothetical protein
MAYRVYRCGQIDYAVGHGDAFQITSPDHYHFLLSNGTITTPHGQGTPCDQNLIDFSFDEARKYAVRLAERSGK